MENNASCADSLPISFYVYRCRSISRQLRCLVSGLSRVPTTEWVGAVVDGFGSGQSHDLLRVRDFSSFRGLHARPYDRIRTFGRSTWRASAANACPAWIGSQHRGARWPVRPGPAHRPDRWLVDSHRRRVLGPWAAKVFSGAVSRFCSGTLPDDRDTRLGGQCSTHGPRRGTIRGGPRFWMRAIGATIYSDSLPAFS